VDVPVARLLGGHTAGELADDVMNELRNTTGTPASRPGAAATDRARIRATRMAERRVVRRPS
jgi:hypothetical protein